MAPLRWTCIIRLLADPLPSQGRSLNSVCPVTWAPPEMHDCNDDNLMCINLIQDTKWKSTYESAPNGLPNNRAYVWILNDTMHNTLDFREEVLATTVCLPFVILGSFQHFLLSRSEKDDACHFSRSLASSNARSAGLLVMLPARYFL